MGPKPNLDLLRSVAVLLVVTDHTALALGTRQFGSWDPGWLGLLGVFMFFVHTSLVLMWSLERKPHTLDFYVRRVFRIYPLALLAIAVAIVTRAPLGGTVSDFFRRQTLSAKDVIVHCLLIQNLRPCTHSIVNVLWTLPLEVQMYILLPALFFFVRRNLSLWPLLLFWTLAAAFSRSAFPPDAVNLVAVVPMFLPGIMAYVRFKRTTPRLPAWLFPLFLGLLLTYGMMHPSTRKGWVFALALGLLLPSFRQMRTVVMTRVSHEIAKYSYGIYLSHPFALVVGMYLLRGHSVALQLAVELLLIALISVASYHLLEKPMIDLGTRVAAFAERRYEQIDEGDRTGPKRTQPAEKLAW